MNHAPFGHLEEQLQAKTETPEWERLIRGIKDADTIYVIGNGGNMAVASHAAADITRLTDKQVWCLDSQSLLTSIANDYGYESIFKNWLEHYSNPNEKSMVIGFSGSGNSKNVVSALNWANERHNWNGALISGSKSTCLDSNIPEIDFGNDYFHQHEILSVMCFYEIVYNLGFECPTIKSELVRKYGTTT
mgnify:FL=1|jgi:phosphoheptose isomerase|tara:strand:- start:8512 stop:9081 length:570 start_codon:yes stop_codon:yes gene_type:complete